MARRTGAAYSITGVKFSPRYHFQPGHRICRVVITMAEHRHERCNARSACDKTEGTARSHGPNKITADRSPQFKSVTDTKFANEIRRNLAVLHSLHRQSEQFVFRRRGDRITALSLVTVFGCEADIDMLAGKMSWPTGYMHKGTPSICRCRAKTLENLGLTLETVSRTLAHLKATAAIEVHARQIMLRDCSALRRLNA
jgi:hypothetical protein